MKILSAQQIRNLDAYNIKMLGVRSIDLMERAATAVAEEICAVFPEKAFWPAKANVMLFCGPGNNGGDGLAVARILSARNYGVEVYLFNVKNNLSVDCAANKERLEECPNVVFHEVVSQFDLPELGSNTLIVDALFGTGLTRPLSGGFQMLVDFINGCNNKVISIDVPSGLRDLDTENTADDCGVGAVVEADYTFTFHCLKPSMLLADTQRYLGEVKVLDIGLEEDELASKGHYSVTNEEDAKALLKPRNTYGHKGTFGHGLLVAGSMGMCGAAVLGAKAALRSGIGKVTIHTPKVNCPVIQTALPEAIVTPDDKVDVLSQLKPVEYSADAIAFGPGVGQSDSARKALYDMLAQKPKRLIIDADGLNLLAKIPEWQRLLPPDTILTPHRKEMERLLAKKMDDRTMLIETERLCKQYGFYVVLKGHRTAVCTPGGQVYFNTTGNSGMATPGSGDVLAGILLSLMAQGYDSESACRLGVFLHGKAGDEALSDESEESMIASDIISHLGVAFRNLKS